MGVDNGALARRYLTEIWSKGNAAAIDELCADDITLREPMSSEPAVGKDEVRKRVEMMPKIFKDASFTIHDVIVSGDRVVALTTWRGTHIGDFFGVKATGKTITCDSAEVMRVKNGKVTENASYFDVYSMFQQMGTVPSPEDVKASTMGKEDTAASQPANA